MVCVCVAWLCPSVGHYQFFTVRLDEYGHDVGIVSVY